MKPFIFFAIYAALFACITASHVYMLLYYWAALLVIAVYLHSRRLYKQQGRLTDFFMLLFVAFIVWERTRHYAFNNVAELLINDAEHILFALLISSIISFLLTLQTAAATNILYKLFVTVFIFNTIGLMNEVFQNLISNRPVYLLTEDSQKDILMNLCGSTLFVVLSLPVASYFPKWCRIEPHR